MAPGTASRYGSITLSTTSRIQVRSSLHLSYVRKHEQPGSVAEGAPAGLRRAAQAPILVAQASSTISTRLRGEPNGYNLIDIEDGGITVIVRDWSTDSWVTRDKASGFS